MPVLYEGVMDYLLSDISIVISKSGLYGFINQVGDNVTSSIVVRSKRNESSDYHDFNFVDCMLKSGRRVQLNPCQIALTIAFPEIPSELGSYGSGSIQSNKTRVVEDWEKQTRLDNGTFV